MKNIHVLPTNKLYITSDEEIKEGDWLFDLDIKRVVRADNLKVLTSQALGCWYYKKIILTTHQDLIKDGVQAIDDEFLEWFVKNPSCEYVEVSEDYFKPSNMVYGINTSPYKIIIPSEKPKQELERGITITHVGKQETLEEAAERLYQKGLKDDLSLSFHDGVKFGAKWQEERMYSEEEAFNLCRDFAIFIQQKRPSYKKQLEWFEQFKKQGGDK